MTHTAEQSGLLRPRVSVCMVTYNHEQFIAQAVNSVLGQQFNARFELVIGEDCSTDKTRQICQQLAAQYPDRIRLMLPDRNLGAFENSRRTYAACHGEYVAICEGDDFWTDPQKLQKQVDLLDRNPKWSACYHRAQVISEVAGHSGGVVPQGPRSAEVTLETLVEGNTIPTCSMVYRGGLVPVVPDWFDQLALGDWPLNILHASRGPFGFIDQVMSAYRVHAGGMWSTLSEVRRLDQTLMTSYAMEQHLEEPAKSLLSAARQRQIQCFVDVPVAYRRLLAGKDLEKIVQRYEMLQLHRVAAVARWIRRLWHSENP